MIDVYFDGNNLSDLAGVTFTKRKTNSLPVRDSKVYKLARSDKSVLTSSEYVNKVISISGNITGDSRWQVEERLESLKALIQFSEKELLVDQGPRQLRYTATMQSITEEVEGGLITFTIEFICSDPMGYEQTDSTLLQPQHVASADTTFALDVDGSYKAEPVITVSLTTVTGGTGATMTLKNNETGQGITITRDFADGDIIEVDCLNKRLTVNGADTDFTGLFPNFFPGNRVLGYVDNFTTRHLSITATYKKRYT